MIPQTKDALYNEEHVHNYGTFGGWRPKAGIAPSYGRHKAAAWREEQQRREQMRLELATMSFAQWRSLSLTPRGITEYLPRGEHFARRA